MILLMDFGVIWIFSVLIGVVVCGLGVEFVVDEVVFMEVV